MLISFTVSNFRSFHEEQTLSLVSSRRTSGHQEHLRSIPKQEEKLLPAAIFYGANGAGKSNLTRALAHMRSLIVDGPAQKEGVSYHPFAFGAHARREPSSFEIRVLLGDDVVEYGFKTTPEAIIEEWLVRVKGGRDEVIFERASKDGKVTIEMDQKQAKAEGSPRVYFLSQAGTLANQLFLSAIASNIPEKELGGVLKGIIEWFRSQLIVIGPDVPFQGLAGLVRDDPSFANFVTEYLRSSSTGVCGLRVEQEPLPSHLVNFFASSHLSPTVGNDELKSLALDDTGSVIQRKPDGTLVNNYIVTTHQTSDGCTADLPFQENSDGTKRLMHLLPALFLCALKPRVFIIDELDRSLHPLLARKFAEFFLSSPLSKESQLILTTHDTNLLDLELFRRDEVWFAEKNKKGATEIYSLSDFKVRNDLRMDKHYLQGRFGAIPFLSGLDRIFPEDAASPASKQKPSPVKRRSSPAKA